MKRNLFLLLGAFIVAMLTWSAVPAKAESVPSPTVIGPIPVNVPPGDPSHD